MHKAQYGKQNAYAYIINLGYKARQYAAHKIKSKLNVKSNLYVAAGYCILVKDIEVAHRPNVVA